MKPLKLLVGLILFCCADPFAVTGQINADLIRESLYSSKINSYGLQSVSRVREFYEHRQFRPAWINNAAACAQLLLLFERSADLGLDAGDYQPGVLHSLQQQAWRGVDQEDSLQMEVCVADAAIHFFRDMAYGNATPDLGYNGLAYNPNCHDVPQLVATAIDKGTLASLPQLLEPTSTEYAVIKNKIISYNTMRSMPAFAEAAVTSNVVNAGNSALMKRLWQLGIIDSITKEMPVDTLKRKVKEMQLLFNLVPDGFLRTPVLHELNVPLQARIGELKFALNTLRWLNCIKSAGSVIVVNIPSANLLVYENGKVILGSRIIVGKQTTRTPTLTSKVTEVVLYPYWNVPKNIATKELLPLIKKNPGYLDRNGFQVLNEHGKVVNPANVNWHELSPGYFPYVLRQSTGCDNSLGLVKLNFYNPYNVYLHDTPWKILFGSNKRYYSHGCMRVDRAMELAHLLLKGNTIAVDTLEDKGCLRNQRPVIVPTSSQIPVFVLYNTAWIDSSGAVSFNEDIYNRFSYLRKKTRAY